MPPQGRDVERVPGLEFGHGCVRERFVEARVGAAIGACEINQAHGHSRGCVIQRAYVEVSHLLHGKQGEATTPRDDASEVLDVVEVRGDDASVADPEARLHCGVEEGHRVLLCEAGEGLLDQHALHCDRRRIGQRVEALKQRQHGAEGRAAALEGETCEALIV